MIIISNSVLFNRKNMCTTQVQMRNQEKERTERYFRCSICRRVVVSTC